MESQGPTINVLLVNTSFTDTKLSNLFASGIRSGYICVLESTTTTEAKRTPAERGPPLQAQEKRQRQKHAHHW